MDAALLRHCLGKPWGEVQFHVLLPKGISPWGKNVMGLSYFLQEFLGMENALLE